MSTESDRVLIQAIRDNFQPPDAKRPNAKKKAEWNRAWEELHRRYAGRLHAFVRHRLSDQGTIDDIVQNTFIGFQNSLVNYDDRRDLQTWLFTIAAHKVTDYLRQSGRRRDQTGPESEDELMDHAPDTKQKTPTANARSLERIENEARAVAAGLKELVDEWKADGKYESLMVLELLFVKGWGNNEVAAHLGVAEQQVANVKFQAKKRLFNHMKAANLPPAVFPELCDA